MNRGGYGDKSSRGNTGRLRMTVATELMRVIRDMRHADELFQWLSDALVQHFSVQVVQFWVAQVDSQGQYFMKLQVLSSRDNSISFRVALSKPFADLAGEIRSWQTDMPLSLVGNVFSSFQASLLQRYGSYYCCAEYLSSKGHYASRGQTALMPLEAVALFFFHQPPQPDFPQSIDYVLRLAMQLAESNGMLVSPSNAQRSAAGYRHHAAQRSASVLADLIPRRTEDTDLMTTSSPLSSSIVISNTIARRLYSAIDGRNNLKELCNSIHLDLDEIIPAIQVLLTARQILLCDSSGQVVDGSQILSNL